MLVDRHVFAMDIATFGSDEKRRVLDIMSMDVYVDNAKQSLLNAIKVYVRSVFAAISESDIAAIKFYRME